MQEKVVDRVCRACGQTHFHIYKHVEKEHALKPHEYYDKFFRGENDGACRTCGTPTPFNRDYRRYERFCSQQCVIKYNNTFHPEWASEGGKKGMKVRIAKDPDCQSKSGKLSNGAETRRRINFFRRDHNNMTPSEYTFWSHPQIQSLSPIVQDRRFLKYRRGVGKGGVESGYILDFSFPDKKLCVEIDHPNSHNKNCDKKRDAFLLEQGWQTLRFTVDQVSSNLESVVNSINCYIGGK
jgi:very-short-patch-repair endonuclease